MKFYYIYKALAHPETNHYVTPFTLTERLMHVAEAKKQLGSRIPWICDSMDNVVKHSMGDRPNSEFIVDPDGRIVVARDWSAPAELRKDLGRLVGEPEQVTTIADLKMPPVRPAHAAPTGIVPRIKVPAGMAPLKVTPVVQTDGEPFYVKLRAEADPKLAQSGTGRLYLGFMLDPLYHVHWNNDAMPVVVEIVDSGGLVVAPGDVEAPTVSAKADADPREFLIDVCSELLQPGQHIAAEITLKVRYFACDDAETFCKPVTQTYVVTLERDRDGGSRRSFGEGQGKGRAGGPGAAGGDSRSPNQMQGRNPAQQRNPTPQQRRRQMNQR